VAAVVVLAGGAPPARAGEWMQVSCVNPNGSTAPSDGWSSFTTGSPKFPSDNDTACSANSPMSATLADQAPANVGDSEDLEYQPPAGSTLAGGTMQASLVANATSSNQLADGTAALFEPAFQYDTSNVFFQCVQTSIDCGNGGLDYAGNVSLPANRGGNLYAQAECGGYGGQCDQNGAFGAWALVQISKADLLLSNSSAPEGSHFSGSALQRAVRGTAQLVFTATDPGGPGVYSVTVSLDGRPVWSGTPDTNGGKCVAVGTDQSSGALMFDWQQPCMATEVVDVPVTTEGLADGPHELTAVIADAAQNTSTVLDQRITTSNPQTTPVPGRRGAVHARFVISWHWSGLRTLLRSISVQRLSRTARVSVACRGRGCPRLRVRSAGARNVKKLLRALGGRRFSSGDRLTITVSAPRHIAERIQLLMRDNRVPKARLLKR
jgi:hypothetical protein